MVAFLPAVPGRLADVPSFARAIGGAESNVACVLAAAGHRTRWVSRIGADGFGDHLLAAVRAYGVDVASVTRDPARPTGIYFRTAGDRATDAHEVAYYRAGSAASAMTAANVDLAAARATRVLHLTGITAALSAGCLGLLRALTAPGPGRPLVSFDVNHRPGLWRAGGPGGPGSGGAEAAEVLLGLARTADLVFVGEDEAQALWGLEGAEAVRAALPEPAVLVVKQGARGATAFEAGGGGTDGDGSGADRESGGPGSGDDRDRVAPGPGPDRVTYVPAPRVDVVAAVGAGDAFAAGFLSATLRGLPARDRLRHGHLAAAAALTAPGDLAAPPDRAHADRLAALDGPAWGRLRLGPGWTRTAEHATAAAGTDPDAAGTGPDAAGAARAASTHEEVPTP
ncbi:sugar kinase [Streptomyces sp. NPDC091281]|uniref:sugar kinase n=1 Tax=Streptomyces sp. NPDC091281 TaxID=3365985 RepID=UPI0037F6A461